MRFVPLLLAVFGSFMLSACVVSSVVGTAVGVTGSVVSTTVGAAGAVVGGAVDAVTGGDSDD